jgi:hypothetical protein
MSTYQGTAAYYRRRAAEQRSRAALARTAPARTLYHELADIFEERALIVEASRGVDPT